MADPFIASQVVSLSMFTPAANIAPAAVSMVATRDLQYGGLHRIVGTVKEKNTPVNTPLSRRVILHRVIDGIPIRETWSDSAGNYMFERIDGAPKYYVVAHDHLNNYNAVIADNLTAEPLP